MTDLEKLILLLESLLTKEWVPEEQKAVYRRQLEKLREKG